MRHARNRLITESVQQTNTFNVRISHLSPLSQCICNVGFYPFADTGACTACPGGMTTRDIGSAEFADCTAFDVATSGIATAFASATDGDKLVMEPGTLTEGDGIASHAQLTLEQKYVSIYCDTSSAEICTWKGAAGKRVVYVYLNGGTTTLGRLIISDGDSGVSMRSERSIQAS